MEYFYIQSKTVKLVSGLRFRYFDLNYVEEKKKKKQSAREIIVTGHFPPLLVTQYPDR